MDAGLGESYKNSLWILGGLDSRGKNPLRDWHIKRVSYLESLVGGDEHEGMVQK